MLEIIPLPALKDNYIRLLKNKANRHIAIVDPREPEPVLEIVKTENLIPVAILITPHHWYHFSVIAGISTEYNIP